MHASLRCIICLVIIPAIPCLQSDGSDHTVVDVPSTIPQDASRDVTDELNAFFAVLPDGSQVRFPEKAQYRVDGTVIIDHKQRITIDGRGTVFRAIDRGEDHAKQENYAGWKRTRNRAHVRLQGGKDLLLKDLEIHGAHPDAGRQGTYDANREAQHGFDVAGGVHITLDNVTVHDVYGDCVYLTKVNGVVIRNSSLTRCGRQGIAIATGEDILIENNQIDDSRRGIIDIEPYGRDWKTGNIRIIGNRLGGSRLLLLPMGGGGTIGTIFIADNVNTAPNGTPAIANLGKPEQHRGPLMMVNNQWTIGGSPAAGLRIRHNDGVLLAGNRFEFPANRKMTGLDLAGSRGVVVGNRLAGAAQILEETAGITELENVTLADRELPGTEWRQIPGGFAVRVTLKDGYVIGLMRGGSQSDPRPEKISGYDRSTEAEFAWFHVRNGELIASGHRE